MAPSNGERSQVHFINGSFGSTVNQRSAVRNVGFAARFGQERSLPRGIALLNSDRWGSNASRLQNRLEPVTSPRFPASAGSVYTVHA